MAIGPEDAEVGHLVCVVGQPGGSGLFQACLEHMAVAALDQSRSDGEAFLNGARLVQTVHTVAEVSMSVAHGGLFFGGSLGFKMRQEFLDDLLERTAAQSFLLRPAPGIRLGRAARFCGRTEILADMIKVAQEGALLAEDFAALDSDPGGPIALGMNLCVQPPARIASTVPPTAAGFMDGVNRRGIGGPAAPFGLGCDQAHLLPFPGTTALS